MSTSAHNTSIYNIEGTLLAWVAAGVATYAAPLAPNASVTDREPEQPLACPSYSVHFSGTQQDASFLGRNVDSGLHGESVIGLLHVMAWASRQDANWRAQLNQMVDAVGKACRKQDSAAIIIKDFYTSATAPANTAYRVTLVSFHQVSLPFIQNPDIEGRAVAILYRYIARA